MFTQENNLEATRLTNCNNMAAIIGLLANMAFVTWFENDLHKMHNIGIGLLSSFLILNIKRLVFGTHLNHNMHENLCI